MPFFFRRDGSFGVQVITGPRSAFMLLDFGPSAVPDFPAEQLPLGVRHCDCPADVARARVLEGVAEANTAHGVDFHPGRVRYLAEDYGEECTILRSAAWYIADQLARVGLERYGATE
jgi:hypothetical protein